MTRAENALACFGKGHSCSQAVLWAFSEDFGLGGEMALRLAGAFGGGIARRGEACGAVTGGLMVIGLRYGMTNAEDKQAKERTYEVSDRFIREFTAKHSSIRCRDLLGCEVGTPAGMAEARSKGLFTTLCPGFVRDAVVILETMVEERKV
jgi:C_GCAxxG_C_C family probable redox protein